jgi:hypothetical protein
MLAPSQQKDQKIKQIQKTEKKSLVDPGRHFPVPYREGPPGWAEHPLRTSGFEIKLNGE